MEVARNELDREVTTRHGSRVQLRGSCPQLRKPMEKTRGWSSPLAGARITWLPSVAQSTSRDGALALPVGSVHSRRQSRYSRVPVLFRRACVELPNRWTKLHHIAVSPIQCWRQRSQGGQTLDHAPRTTHTSLKSRSHSLWSKFSTAQLTGSFENGTSEAAIIC